MTKRAVLAAIIFLALCTMSMAVLITASAPAITAVAGLVVRR